MKTCEGEGVKLALWSEEFGKMRTPSWKIGAVIPAKHAWFESVIEEGSTNGVEIPYLYMIWFWKVVEVEQEKSEPGPNSIRLLKDKPFYFLLPRAQKSHASGKVEGVFIMSRQG